MLGAKGERTAWNAAKHRRKKGAVFPIKKAPYDEGSLKKMTMGQESEQLRANIPSID